MTDTPTPADLAAFGASEAACYLYPGEDQQPLRAAYCAGAASMVTTACGTITPLNPHKTDNRGIEMTEAADNLRKAKEREFSLCVIGQGGGVKCISLNDYRVAGEKAWGGGYVIAEFTVQGSDILRAIGLDHPIIPAEKSDV